jgi:hypothetical protein
MNEKSKNMDENIKKVRRENKTILYAIVGLLSRNICTLEQGSQKFTLFVIPEGKPILACTAHTDLILDYNSEQLSQSRIETNTRMYIGNRLFMSTWMRESFSIRYLYSEHWI